MEELQEAFYDHYNLCLSAVEVLVVAGGVAWEGARGSQVSPLHLLRPTQLQLQLMKSLLPNDTKLPTLVPTCLLHVLCIILHVHGIHCM